MLYPHFLRKIVPGAILGAILIATVFTAPPVLAITFNKPRIELLKEALIIKSCIAEAYSVVYYYSGGTLMSQQDCVVGRILIDEAGYNQITGQPSYVGENFVAVEDFNGTIETDNFNVVSAIASFPDNFIATILAYAGRLFTDLYILIALAIGLPLAFWIIKKIINLWKKEDLEDRRRRTFADRDFEYKRKNYHWKGD